MRHGANRGLDAPLKAAVKSPSHLFGIRPLSAVIAVGGFVLTAGLAWTASSVNHNSNSRLLQLQVRQAASALVDALPSVQTQLIDALRVATDTGKPSAFKHFASSKVGQDASFVSISLWQKKGTGSKELALVGAKPQLVGDGKAGAFFATLRPSGELQVTTMLSGRKPWLGYAEMLPGRPGQFVYAESPLPARHRLVLPRSSAFNDLNFAIYFGRDQSNSQLIGSSVPTPITGLRSATSVPFGDTAITLVGTPTRQLAGGLSAALSWIVLAVGTALSVGTAATLEYVLRRRRLAEQLAAENEKLYVEQRDIAGTLQHALLPKLPSLPLLEIAARYLPGVAGIEVGGDWYDVIPCDDKRCFFVVGDVSGRGLEAATTMASLRFATRAYVAQGDSPAQVLTKLNSVLDFDATESFATVLIGEVDLAGGRLNLANAGHLPPLLLEGDQHQFLELSPGAPIGIGGSDPGTLSVKVAPGSIVLAYTDGLVERRREHLHEGLNRLAQAAMTQDRTIGVDTLLDRLTAQLVPGGADDDTVLLGMRWRQ